MVMYILGHAVRIGKCKRSLALGADQDGSPYPEDEQQVHQRKQRAAQQLRELEGKERLEKSRVERRLKLTQCTRQGMLPRSAT